MIIAIKDKNLFKTNLTKNNYIEEDYSEKYPDAQKEFYRIMGEIKEQDCEIPKRLKRANGDDEIFEEFEKMRKGLEQRSEYNWTEEEIRIYQENKNPDLLLRSIYFEAKISSDEPWKRVSHLLKLLNIDIKEYDEFLHQQEGNCKEVFLIGLEEYFTEQY